MNANAARALFLVANVVLLAALSYDVRTPAAQPHVAAGTVGSDIEAPRRDADAHTAQLSVALPNEHSRQAKR